MLGVTDCICTGTYNIPAVKNNSKKYSVEFNGEQKNNLLPTSTATATAAARNKTTTTIQTTDLQLFCRDSRLSLVT